MNRTSDSFWKNMAGVVTSPGDTLGRLMKEKKWVPVFLLILVVMIIFAYVAIPYQTERLSQNPDFSEEQILFLKNNTMLSRLMAGGMAAVGMFISIAVGAFFVYLFYGIGGVEGTYSEFFSLVVNASVIDTAIPNVINTVFLLFWGSLAIFPNAALLVPGLEANSFTFLALSRIELFSVWYIVALSAGAAVFAGLRFKKTLFVGIIYFMFKTLTGVGFSYLVLKIFHG